MLNDASGLSYDLASLNAQITVLFDLSTAPNSASALKQRLADIRSTVSSRTAMPSARKPWSNGAAHH